ncbi:MAG TPA: hypothetical protein VJQ54_05815 [Candidatus Sulfotelmatobacter sp.]|nr:hypothetical protein [Candidatus Sulfotelmatobacter sp.]
MPTTTLAAQTANNTSAASTFPSQSNGNFAPRSVSKVDVHSLLYPGADTKIFAHMMVWFGGSNHMNVGYSSTDPAQVHRQIVDMISRGIDGVIIDWYGPNNNEDQATRLVMAEAEKHPGFTFAIMVDQGAIKWNSCAGCSPQQALISQLQYVEQTYFPSPSYFSIQGRPVVTNFNIDLAYSVNWQQVATALATQPVFWFQNNSGFTHPLSAGSYSWVMPTTTDYGRAYLTSFYDTGLALPTEETVGASYKGFNDSLASWGSNRIMGQQCGQTWLQTFSDVNSLFNSGKQLRSLQLVTWNDYEEGTEIETGINNCFSLSASVSSNSLRWTVQGSESTVHHYVAYVSVDGQNLMPLADVNPGNSSLNLCSYSIPNGSYTAFVQAVGKPSIANRMSAGIKFQLNCAGSTIAGSGGSGSSGGSGGSGGTGTPSQNASIRLAANPSAMTLSNGSAGTMQVTITPQAGSFNNTVALACSGLPSNLSCSFSPSAVTPGAGAISSTLTVRDTSVVASGRQGRNFVLATGMFSLGLFGITLIGRIRTRSLLAALGSIVILGTLVMVTSCGGNSMKAVSAASAIRTYAVTIQGAAGSVQAATTVSVTVE